MVDINGLRCYIHTELDCCETGDNISVICEKTFLNENTFQINYNILFGIVFPAMISTKRLFLVPLTFVNNLVTCFSCKCCELAPFV